MKFRYIQMLAMACISLFTFTSQAQTDIYSSAISGHWTLGGSPYIIHQDIQVGFGNTLKIDPGVDIQFAGAYQFFVFGTLLAMGDINDRIYFHAQDTTGFSDNTTYYTGGWKGITFGDYSYGTMDSCVFQYCDVADMKTIMTTVYSSVKLTNSRFFHNYYTIEHYPSMVDSNSLLELDSCEFYNNIGDEVINTWYGRENIHDCKFHDNNNNLCMMYTDKSNMLFQNNEVYNNYGLNWGIMHFFAAPTDTLLTHVTIKGNKIHHNNAGPTGPVFLDGGNAVVLGNLICNNQFFSVSGCPWVEGGAAIKVSGGKHSIRNNIIANNYANGNGGGIDIDFGAMNILNNLIINNKAAVCGGISFRDETAGIAICKYINIKNNIFIGNSSGGGVARTVPDIGGGTAGTVTIDHNWFKTSMYADVSLTSAISGDSTTNVTGTDPMLASPTLTNSVTEDATVADFTTQDSSKCVNKGTITGIVVDSFDYAGNTRVIDGIIDIGPYETIVTSPVIHVHTSATPAVSLNTGFAVYPNPANGYATVDAPSKGGSINVVDIYGRTVRKIQCTAIHQTIGLQGMEPGLYSIIWNGADGGYATCKLVVR